MAGFTIRLAKLKPWPTKISALKSASDFSYSKFINFTAQIAAQQADIVALRLSFAAAAMGVWRPASQPAWRATG